MFNDDHGASAASVSAPPPVLGLAPPPPVVKPLSAQAQQARVAYRALQGATESRLEAAKTMKQAAQTLQQAAQQEHAVALALSQARVAGVQEPEESKEQPSAPLVPEVEEAAAAEAQAQAEIVAAENMLALFAAAPMSAKAADPTGWERAPVDAQEALEKELEGLLDMYEVARAHAIALTWQAQKTRDAAASALSKYEHAKTAALDARQASGNDAQAVEQADGVLANAEYDWAAADKAARASGAALDEALAQRRIALEKLHVKQTEYDGSSGSECSEEYEDDEAYYDPSGGEEPDAPVSNLDVDLLMLEMKQEEVAAPAAKTVGAISMEFD